MTKQITQERIIDLLNRGGSVQLSIDGNVGCALLGPNIQDGEAEFETINEAEFNDGYEPAARRAMVRALKRLKARCADQSLPYNTSLSGGLF